MGKNQLGDSYTLEQKEWARNYFSTHSLKETTKAFNEKYNTNKSVAAIHHQVHGVKKDLHVHYTQEMCDFLKEQVSIPNNTRKPITQAFNKQFGTNVRWEALKRKACVIGAITKSNRDKNYTYHPKHRYQIGDERIHRKWDGETYIVVKVSDKHKSHKSNWILKHHLVWEKANGKIPKDHIIIFLDGNTLNCELSNLRCVDKATFKKLQGNRWRSYYGLGKISEAYLEVCETENLINQKGGNYGRNRNF